MTDLLIAASMVAVILYAALLVFGVRVVAFLLVVFTITYLMSANANAEGINCVNKTVGVHMFSQHAARYSSAGETYNNVNPGLYFRCDDVAIGTYRNSERKQSAYVAYMLGIGDYFDVAVGLVSGYRRMAIAPMVVPSVHFPIGMDSLHARIHFIPPVEKGAAAVHFSLEYRY